MMSSKSMRIDALTEPLTEIALRDVRTFFHEMGRDFAGWQRRQNEWSDGRDLALGFAVLGQIGSQDNTIEWNGTWYNAEPIGQAQLPLENASRKVVFLARRAPVTEFFEERFLAWTHVAGGLVSDRLPKGCNPSNEVAKWMSLLWGFREQHAEEVSDGWLWENPMGASWEIITKLRLREIVSAVPGGDPPKVIPSWDRINGKLSFDGECIRTVRILRKAQNIVKVLDAFEEEGWPQRIDDPLPDGSPKKFHDTISSLNKNLQRMRFRADGEGQGFIWQPIGM